MLITEDILQHLTLEQFVTALILPKRPTSKDSFDLQITDLRILKIIKYSSQKCEIYNIQHPIQENVTIQEICLAFPGEKTVNRNKHRYDTMKCAHGISTHKDLKRATVNMFKYLL